MKESEIQNSIRLRLNAYGRYFRNNVGVAKGHDGRLIRFGLCKGSSDLIGWTEIDGVAVFTAVEVKRPMKKPTEHQQNFIDRVNEAGGIAFVATSSDEAVEKIQYEITRRK